MEKAIILCERGDDSQIHLIVNGTKIEVIGCVIEILKRLELDNDMMDFIINKVKDEA